jgi:hypothetical protein
VCGCCLASSVCGCSSQDRRATECKERVLWCVLCDSPQWWCVWLWLWLWVLDVAIRCSRGARRVVSWRVCVDAPTTGQVYWLGRRDACRSGGHTVRGGAHCVMISCPLRNLLQPSPCAVGERADAHPHTCAHLQPSPGRDAPRTRRAHSSSCGFGVSVCLFVPVRGGLGLVPLCCCLAAAPQCSVRAAAAACSIALEGRLCVHSCSLCQAGVSFIPAGQQGPRARVCLRGWGVVLLAHPQLHSCVSAAHVHGWTRLHARIHFPSVACAAESARGVSLGRAHTPQGNNTVSM